MADPTAQTIKDELTNDPQARGYLSLDNTGRNHELLITDYTTGEKEKRLQIEEINDFLATGTNMKFLSDAQRNDDPDKASAAMYLMNVAVPGQIVSRGTLNAIKAVFGEDANPLVRGARVSRADELWDRDPTIEEVRAAAAILP
tara:strand:+ start:2891 stop:3322 length:432 start_codon:yes stop_codon:yes gene_type:complete